MEKLRLWVYYFKHAFASILGNRLIYLISTGTIAIALVCRSFLYLPEEYYFISPFFDRNIIVPDAIKYEGKFSKFIVVRRKKSG